MGSAGEEGRRQTRGCGGPPRGGRTGGGAERQAQLPEVNAWRVVPGSGDHRKATYGSRGAGEPQEAGK